MRSLRYLSSECTMRLHTSLMRLVVTCVLCSTTFAGFGDRESSVEILHVDTSVVEKKQVDNPVKRAVGVLDAAIQSLQRERDRLLKAEKQVETALNANRKAGEKASMSDEQQKTNAVTEDVTQYAKYYCPQSTEMTNADCYRNYIKALDLWVVSHGGVGSNAIIEHLMEHGKNMTVQRRKVEVYQNTCHLGYPPLISRVWKGTGTPCKNISISTFVRL